MSLHMNQRERLKDVAELAQSTDRHRRELAKLWLNIENLQGAIDSALHVRSVADATMRETRERRLHVV